MNIEDTVRANEFDQWVGEIQTKQTIRYGVGNSILDIGCGIGMFTPLLCSRFSRVVGLDPSEEALKVARKHKEIEWVCEYGETYKTTEKFDTVNMNMLLEHVDSPVELLKNCKTLLSSGGRIIAQVPNSNSISRRLGVLMGIIPNIEHISERERDFFGHKRTYTIHTLYKDCLNAGLTVEIIKGVFYKPLPNEILLSLCKKNGDEWTKKFLAALEIFGEGRDEDCADLLIVCK